MFQLAGPMASFGEVAVGEVRGSEAVPSRSAMLGLLAAALGIRRDQDDQHSALSAAVQFAMRVESADFRMLDFHTAQAAKRAKLKGRPLRTRRDELQAENLSTILSSREYHADYRASIAVLAQEPFTPECLQRALLAPKFMLFLGRKCSPLAWPLAPSIVVAAGFQAAFAAWDVLRESQRKQWLSQGGDKPLWPFLDRHAHNYRFETGMTWTGTEAVREVLRRDQPISRSRWLFAQATHQRVQTAEKSAS